ncbi:MAG: type II secretion system protein, partial [Coraliomargarita sp.]
MKRISHKGFTILELMVVTTIIGIIALMGIPSVRTATHRATATATASDLRKLSDAVELYS